MVKCLMLNIDLNRQEIAGIEKAQPFIAIVNCYLNPSYLQPISFDSMYRSNIEEESNKNRRTIEQNLDKHHYLYNFKISIGGKGEPRWILFFDG